MQQATALGEWLTGELTKLCKKHPAILREVRGLGMLQAATFASGVDGRQLLARLREGGVLATPCWRCGVALFACADHHQGRTRSGAREN